MVVDHHPQQQESVVPSAQMVGREFVRQYYTMMGDSPQQVYRFYSKDSVYAFNTSEPAIGQVGISEKIEMLKLHDCHAKIRALDSYETLHRAVVVQVIGDLSINAGVSRRFAQTFVLAPQSEKKYYVLNNIFRYLDELFDKEADKTLQNNVDMLPALNGNAHEDEINNNARLSMPVYNLHISSQQASLSQKPLSENCNTSNRYATATSSVHDTVDQTSSISTNNATTVVQSVAAVVSSINLPTTLQANEQSSQNITTEWNASMAAAKVTASSPPSNVSSTASSFYVPPATPLHQQTPDFQSPLPSRSMNSMNSSDERRQKQSSGSTNASETSPPQPIAVESNVQTSVTAKIMHDQVSSPETTPSVKTDAATMPAPPTITPIDQFVVDDGASTSPKGNSVASSWAKKVAGNTLIAAQIQKPAYTNVSNSNGSSSWSTTPVNQASPLAQQLTPTPSALAPPVDNQPQQTSCESPAPSSSGMINGGSKVSGNVAGREQTRGRRYSYKELAAPVIFVSNLPGDISEQELRDCFSVFGNLTFIELRKRESNLPSRPYPSFAFITFDGIGAAVRVMESRNSLSIRGNHQLYVNPKREERSNDRTGGGSGSVDRGYGGPNGAQSMPRGGIRGGQQSGRGSGVNFESRGGPYRGGASSGGGGYQRGSGAARTFTQSGRGGGGPPHFFSNAGLPGQQTSRNA
uniref:Uncharacterized protein n=1 Tax=Romanomermis culicivorax TaxID=13658 RepID=A0A915K2M6_ROMCU